MKRLPGVIATAVLLGMIAFAGCTAPQNTNSNDNANGSTSAGSGSDTGTASFFVKDAPADDFESVYITFHHVEVHMAGGENETNDTEDMNETSSSAAPTTTTNTTGNATNSTSPAVNTTASTPPTTSSTMMDDNESGMGGGWITIVDTDHTVDLKAFQGDASAFLGDQAIRAGTYTQIRIHVTAAWGMQNGTRTNITVPSDELKVVRPWTVVAGKETALTVDFDLSKSLQKTGNGEYKLKPTLKLSVQNDAHTQSSRTSAPTGTMMATTASHGKPTNTTNTHKPT